MGNQIVINETCNNSLSIKPNYLDAASQLSAVERLAWLRLARTNKVGPRLFARLIAYAGSAQQAIKMLPELARRGGGRKPPLICSAELIEQELAALTKFGARLIMLPDPEYPAWLRRIADAPPVLTLYGNAEILQRQSLAMVGARNASLSACNYTTYLAQNIGKTGVAIISGLARGIDTIAHQAALASGTIAVVAGGIDHIYPTENTKLFHAIVEQGGVVLAEQPFGAAPKSQHFPQRNRIISGLAPATLVVQVSLNSGSLITARCAIEQGRELLVVPGFPSDPRAAGCNQLLKAGATIITSANDALEVLRSIAGQKVIHANEDAPTIHAEQRQQFAEQEYASARAAVLQALSTTPITVDELISATGLPTALILALLLALELTGNVAREFGNKVVRVYNIDSEC